MVKDEIAAIGENPATQFERLRLKALLKAEQLLDLPTDLDTLGGDIAAQHKRFVLQGEMAKSIIADAIKIDDNALRHQERADTLSLIRDRMAAVKLPDKPE